MHGVIRDFMRMVLIIGLLVAMPQLGFAAGSDCDPAAARAVSVQGNVEFKQASGTTWQPVQLNDTFCPGDEIRVSDNSRASLSLANESNLRLNANSSIVIQEFKEKTSFIDIFKGAAHFFARKPNKLEVNTPYVVAGVRGTEFLIRVEEDQTFLSVFEGGVLASNDAGEATLTSGQAAITKKGQAPVLTTVAKPRDAVQWALYYPPVVYVPPGQPAMREDLNDPVFLANRASQSLAVGKIDEAESDLQKALSIDATSADALSLQSIVALVKNDKDKAYTLAQQAVEANPKSASAHVAKSYAQQARFDLEGARDSLMAAVTASPDDALAHARLAEIHLSFGDLDKALQSAQKAVAMAPGLSRTQTVLGFAYLTQIKTGEAMAAFQQAILSDQADPMPRLGMGLAKIRVGQLEEGRERIEIAASLDPNNSLIRSYLGKAFYEEKRTGLDEREYQISKELDPNDPTPWFYDAIAKQTTNRPVEALQNMEKAIELNDNRAVYRSKLQLDSDLAARSSSLARIYNNLGFQQRALVEGWNSINTDPTNFSAHRFLADTYASRPRQEIARVSELLQSQLLQPTNITPLQPAQAESNLFQISRQGAATAGFNTFNPLFNRDQATAQLNGLIAENSTWAGEGIVSAIYNKLSLSAGYSHFETDGWRENADQDDDIANIFAQYEFNHKTTIQAEYRYRETKRGDTQLRFFLDDFRPDRRQEDETDTVRLGFRHAFSPSSNLIGNFAYQKLEDSISDFGFIEPADVGVPLPPAPPFIRDDINAAIDQDGYTGELSYLFRSQYINAVSGAGYFKINQDTTLDRLATYPGNPVFGIPPITFFDTTTLTEADIDHANAYLYSYITPHKSVTITIGASGDFFDFDEKENDTNDLSKDQFNPKFGVAWNPVSNTTLRAAAFKTLKRTLITDQTLEPTQVAGFSQFFDDPNATESWVYGAGFDQKFTQNIYGGVEYYRRDLEVPYFDLPDPPAPQTPQLTEADWDEDYARAYLYWTPHNWLALKAEYRYEKTERGSEFNLNIEEVKTHSVPLGISFFHPSGLSAFFGATYYNQEGKFVKEGPIALPSEEGEDNFWLADAAISYRLPKRYGLLTIGANNLFDEEFEFADTDIENPRIQPGQSFFIKAALSFP